MKKKVIDKSAEKVNSQKFNATRKERVEAPKHVKDAMKKLGISSDY